MFIYDETVQQRSFLLTSGFEELLSHDILQESYTSRLLRYTNGAGTEYERSGIITMDGTELYSIQPGEDVVYFDEDFLVISYEEYSSAQETVSYDYYPVEYNYKVISLNDGTVISEGASFVSFNLEYDYTKPSDNILIYKEETLKVLNREKGITAQKYLPGIYYINLLKDDLFCVNADFGENDYTSMILDQDLNEVVPGGIYNNIRQGMSWSGNDYKYFDVLIGEWHDERYTGWFADLLDLEGKTLVSGLNSIFEVGFDRIAVRKGFDIGLMDWQGNWIVKKSVFSELQDD
jgi:hypothetical protein